MPNLIEDRSNSEIRFMCSKIERKQVASAQKLSGYKDVNGIVLGIPSGGVPVAAEIAKVPGLSPRRNHCEKNSVTR